jgi:hypothetical protein
VFENRVLRKIFGPKWSEVTGKCQRLHNEEIHDLQSSPNTIRAIKLRKMRWAGHVARNGERRGAYRSLMEKLKRKRALGRPRRKWEYNIKINLREVGKEAHTGFIWLRLGTGGGLL